MKRLLILLLLVLLLPCAAARDSAGQYRVEPIAQWDALFDRSSGWTGADGIYSIPLSGRETPDALGGRTLFVFSDTFIGEVGGEGQRLPGTTMVNNTLALLSGADPDPQRIRFICHPDRAVFSPGTPASQPGDWYWLSDGIAVDDRIRLFAMRMQSTPGGDFNFAVAGVSLITIPLAGPPGEWEQQDTPLFHRPDDGRGEMVFGLAIMPNTAFSGSPNPDGFIYIFGTRNDPLSKKLLAARVHEDAADFLNLKYWDGATWNSDIDNAAPLTGRLSMEFSVTPLPDGRFILVFQQDGIGRDVAIRFGESPVGPWGPIHQIYHCPEPDFDPDIFTYNAKAHPHLSAPGELLISYNVNTFDFWDHFTWADIYRPRFIRLTLGGPYSLSAR